MQEKPIKIIISRTDNLGDVVLTLPLSGFLKSVCPTLKIYFIGKTYTKPIIESSRFVDVFLDREELLKSPQKLTEINADAIIFVFPDKEIAKIAKKSNIPLRVGTSHRLFHWVYCNKLVNFSRKNSNLHETQLNFKLLKPLAKLLKINYLNKIIDNLKLEDFSNFYGMEIPKIPTEKLKDFLKKDTKNNTFNLIFHPKSNGSAREWGLKNYTDLAKILHQNNLENNLENNSNNNNNKFHIFITGTQAEGEIIRKELAKENHQNDIQLFDNQYITDLTGKLSLTELLAFIGLADGLLACSTGPLHIAAALGKYALGIYPPIKPMHPMRWQPLGEHAAYMCVEKICNDCKKTQNCFCIREITPQQVADAIFNWKIDKLNKK